jgi:hypothetical protein
MPLDHAYELLSVYLQLVLPYPEHLGEGGAGGGLARGHVFEGFVAENDVGGDALFAGEFCSFGYDIPNKKLLQESTHGGLWN